MVSVFRCPAVWRRVVSNLNILIQSFLIVLLTVKQHGCVSEIATGCLSKRVSGVCVCACVPTTAAVSGQMEVSTTQRWQHMSERWRKCPHKALLSTATAQFAWRPTWSCAAGRVKAGKTHAPAHMCARTQTHTQLKDQTAQRAWEIHVGNLSLKSSLCSLVGVCCSTCIILDSSQKATSQFCSCLCST